jgi:predicted DNA-binding protein (MmcQ/YjbR family)
MTTLDAARAHLLSLPGASEYQPFGPDNLVFRVGAGEKHKMFALLALEAHPPRVNLKCDPERAVSLRERYGCVLPGYHMSKTHWNTVVLSGEASPGEVRAWMEHSHALVLASLPRSVRAEVGS